MHYYVSIETLKTVIRTCCPRLFRERIEQGARGVHIVCMSYIILEYYYK